MANLLDDYKYDGKQVPMAEVRVLHQSCGTQIRAIRSDTFKIFTPGLRENAERIRSIPPITESYGTHARHKVDIYQSHEHNTGREPLLVFLYAGGGTRGNRSLAVVPDNLVYNNLGTYFASRGITTLVPDYRRVDGKKGGDGAVYPSGGEDIALLLKWLSTSDLVANGHRDVYILGNSAGAIHATTFLFDSQFHNDRKQYVGSSGLVQGALNAVGAGRSITIQGAILLGLPSEFSGAAKGRRDHSNVYYGSEDKASKLSPLGLLSAVTGTTSTPSLTSLAIPHLLVLTAEYDPHDEIVKPTETFVQKFQQLFPSASHSIQYKILTGHNHISPIAALMSGDQMGEEWAEQLVHWILGTSHIHVDGSAKEILRGPRKILKDDTADITLTEDDKTYKSHHGAGADQDNETTDLNREGGAGHAGKAETEPKEHEPRENVTPQDRA